ncbi:MAG: relaxase/mobilization nuclease domain-containing protein, partial [Proteobacteria bacterium]|nr:relaxase/mobilization nuclease domain-containing protein [Pseudomonadota bacterium]
MIPKVNNRGHGFKGVAAYLMHDKEADTAERVEWTQTGNMHTDDIKKAALIMAWTDMNAEALKESSGGSLAGRKPEVGGVYHYSLSWSQDEKPEREHMQAQALETLQRLGLEKHQYFIVAHSDTEHTHLHVVSNLTNPETGQRLTPSFDKRELQSWALEYEREHGIKCKMREENAAKREQGEFVKFRDTKQDYSERVTRAFYAADNGKAFVHSLEHEGLHLDRGRRGGFVIVDETGDM